MDSITLAGLAAIVAAVVGPMLGCVVVMMRYQHKDNVKTHALIGEARQETRDLIAGSEKETHRLIERHGGEHNKRLDRVISSLADARERLARIEGHLGIGSRPADEADSGGTETA